MPERRCYVCPKCVPPHRVFLAPGEQPPRCPEHGRMIPQPNRPYLGVVPLRRSLA